MAPGVLGICGKNGKLKEMKIFNAKSQSHEGARETCLNYEFFFASLRPGVFALNSGLCVLLRASERSVRSVIFIYACFSTRTRCRLICSSQNGRKASNTLNVIFYRWVYGPAFAGLRRDKG
jgi:hypothetical protein